MAGRRWAGAAERGRLAPGPPPRQQSGRQNRLCRTTRQGASVQATLERSRSQPCPVALPSLLVRCRGSVAASAAPASRRRRRRSAYDLRELCKKLPDDVHLLLVCGQVLLPERDLGRRIVLTVL